MPQDKAKIAKNSFMLFLRMGVSVIVSLFTSRIVLQQLGVSDYGLFNVVGGIITLITFLNASLIHGIQRYINYFIAKQDSLSVTKIFSAAYIIIIALSILILILGESVGLWFINGYLNIPPGSLSSAIWVFQLSLLGVIVTMAQIPLTSTILANEDMQVYAYVSLLEVGIKLAIAYALCVILSKKLIWYAGLQFFASCIISLFYLLYCHRHYKTCRFIKVKEKSLYKDLMSFSGWTVFGSSMNIVSIQGMNVVLNIYFGTVVNAARGIAVQISSQLDNLINNIQVAMNPQLIQLYSSGEVKEMRNLLIDNFKWNFFMLWILGFPIIFNTKLILYYWLGEVPEYTVIFSQIIVVRCFLKVFERPLITCTMAYGRMMLPSLIPGILLLAEVIVAIVLFKIGYPPYWAYILDLLAILGCIIFDMTFLREKGIFFVREIVPKVVVPICLIIIICLAFGFGISYNFVISNFWCFVSVILLEIMIAILTIAFIGFNSLQRNKIFKSIKCKIWK